MYAPLDDSGSLSSVKSLFLTHAFQRLYSRPSSFSPEKVRTAAASDEEALAEAAMSRVKILA